MKTLLKRLLFFLARSLSRLPLGALYVLSDMARPFVGGYRRKIVRRNIANSFPEKTEEERKAIERGFYHFLCDYGVETLKLLTISKQEMMRRMRFEGVEEVRAELTDHPFVFLYLGHYCNWEWISSLPAWVDCQCGQLYKHLHDPVLDQFFYRLRTRFEALNIDKNNALRSVLKLKAEGTPAIIGFISDQAPKWDSIHDWVDFLNQDTPVFTGTERIAKKVNAAIYFVDVERPKRGYYVGRLRKMTDNVGEFGEYKLTELYMKQLEAMIRRAPEFYLWSHNRWKRQRNNAPEGFRAG